MAHIKTEANSGDAFFDKPLFFGVRVEGDGNHVLPGGLYAMATEDGLNGVMGWEAEALKTAALSKTGKQYDASRPYLYKQLDSGRRFEFYIPCK